MSAPNETAERVWYAYVPLLWAGSGGNRMLGKFIATPGAVRDTYGSCATIDYRTGVVEFYKRP